MKHFSLVSLVSTENYAGYAVHDYIVSQELKCQRNRSTREEDLIGKRLLIISTLFGRSKPEVGSTISKLGGNSVDRRGIHSGEFTRSFDEPAISIGVPISRGLRAELNGTKDPVNGGRHGEKRRWGKKGKSPGDPHANLYLPSRCVKASRFVTTLPAAE